MEKVKAESAKQVMDILNEKQKTGRIGIIGTTTKNGMPFLYTVGADILIGAELIVIGIDHQSATSLVSYVIASITTKLDYQIQNGYTFENVFDSGYAVKTVKCLNTDDWTFVLKLRKYTGDVYQILVEDNSHVMQGDEGYSIEDPNANINLGV